jgi:hypothetical protein
MKKVSEYREHAEECRVLARAAASPQHRDMLLNMASTWDALADDRQKANATQERLAKLDVAPAESPPPK